MVFQPSPLTSIAVATSTTIISTFNSNLFGFMGHGAGRRPEDANSVELLIPLESALSEKTLVTRPEA